MTQTPAEMLMNRKLHTPINTVVPNINTTVEHKQLSQELAHDSRTIQELEIGQSVSVQNYSSGDKWVPGYVAKWMGPVSYTVEVSTGGVQQMWKWHADQIRHRVSTLSSKVISNVDFSAEVEEAPEHKGSDTQVPEESKVISNVDFSAEVEEAPEHQESDTQVPEENNVAVDDIEGLKVDIVLEPVRRRYLQMHRKPKQPHCCGCKN